MSAELDAGGCVPCRTCGGDQSRGWHLHDQAEDYALTPEEQARWDAALDEVGGAA